MSGEPPHFIFNCVLPEVDAHSIGMEANPRRILPFWFSQYLWLLILLILFLNGLSDTEFRRVAPFPARRAIGSIAIRIRSTLPLSATRTSSIRRAPTVCDT
jgi:hypothetical protein